MNPQPASAGKKTAYERPAIVTYTADAILARLGPALAAYSIPD